MKEDILEQLVDDFLQSKGYFTRHNIKFRPDADHLEFIKNKDSNHSDIDVIGINPLLHGAERVLCVSCKSWQSGFNPAVKIKEIEHSKIRSGREVWKGFRELVQPKWSHAYIDAVYKITGQKEFTYITAVTVLKGDASIWENHIPFLENIKNPIKIVTLREMLSEIYTQVTTTTASSDIGRMLQLIKASKWTQ
ncbi:hypothetical protein [Cellvibrio sp.]|uniref:hypothetical protein n=1 Tax=Cellvibrio sp. TaxID=1965322 RepID=UPI0039647959